MNRTSHRGPNPLRTTLLRTAFQERHFPQHKPVDLDPPPPPKQRSPKGVPLNSMPAGVSEPADGFRECNTVAGKPVSCLLRIVMLFSSTASAVIPARVLCDSGASHCVMSPAYARRLGCDVPEKPERHGTMIVADGSAAPIYGRTPEVRIRPPTHLNSRDGSRKLITALPPMRCLVADISEDFIMGFNSILPLQRGFASDDAGNHFKMSASPALGSPTVNIPLVGQTKATSVTHHKLDRGPLGPAIETFHSELSPPGPRPWLAQDTDTLSGAPDVLGGRSTAKDRQEALGLLQYAKKKNQMVAQVEWLVREDMATEAALFPDTTALHHAPVPDHPEDLRREPAWQSIQERVSEVFAKPHDLPPYRLVNGSCNLKLGCTVSSRAGVGRLSQEEIPHTRLILTDYSNKGQNRPSHSRTVARLFFVTKPNGGLRSVVN